MDNWITELEKLGNLRDQGILTEEEFQAGKKKLLAMRKKNIAQNNSNPDEANQSNPNTQANKTDSEEDSSNTGTSKRAVGNTGIPVRIGSYRIISILGKGGMGAVYKARHMEESWARRQGGDVAIKVMLPKYSEDPAFRDRFMREASLGQEVQHENVAKVHEVIVDEGSVGLVMEFVSGDTLQDLIPEKGMPIDDAVKILMPVAEALDFIHKKGIVHRDLKPENIKVTPEGRPVILDFGIAKSDDGDMSMTKTGVMMGTVSYMAPEQIDAKNVGPEADRYAFGIMTYELLTGQKPWEKDLSEGRIYTLKLQGNLVPAHFVHEGISETLSKSVMRMMALRPQHRHQSCALFIRSVANGGADLEKIEEDTLSKEDFERVRQHYGNLAAAIEELEVQVQAQDRRLQQYTRERDATLTSLENRYNKEREIAENTFAKVQEQIDQAITDVHEEFKKRRAKREDDIPQLRKEVKELKSQIKELEGKLESGWNSFLSMFNAGNKREIEDDIQRLKRKMAEKNEELEKSQRELPNDITNLQIEEEKAVDNFNRAGEARINAARVQMQRKINGSKKILQENQDKVQSRFNEEKKLIDAAVIDLRRELESKADQITALKEAYPDDVWVIKSKKVMGSIEFELVQISSGKFWMGAKGDDENHLQDERPRHQVELTKSFWILTTLVPQNLYEEVMGENPSKFRGSRKPVENVSWLNAIEFCNELSKRQNLNPCYTIIGESDVKWDPMKNGYRLPTEAEWEYAALGGKEHLYAGSDNIADVAWFAGNTSFETKPVAKRRANSYGLFDMCGNLWEWCWDKYSKYPSMLVVDPTGTDEGSRRVRRGGSWRNKANHIRITNRAFSDPSSLSSAYGFRVVRTLFERK